jgi:uncharacterized protein
MLNLSLVAISRGEVSAQWEVPVDHAVWEGVEPHPAETVHVEVEARPVGEDSVFVRGRVRTTVELSCRRCLGPVRREIDEPIEIFFDELADEEAADLAGEVYALPGGTELDLAGPIREQLVLRLPRYALCDEACRGLCAQCGADLNQTACECVPQTGAGPWDALKKLKFD